MISKELTEALCDKLQLKIYLFLVDICFWSHISLSQLQLLLHNVVSDYIKRFDDIERLYIYVWTHGRYVWHIKIKDMFLLGYYLFLIRSDKWDVEPVNNGYMHTNNEQR